MFRITRCFVLLSFLALALAPAHALGATTPTSSTGTDPAGDQTHYELWNRYPGLRPAVDLRKVVFATERGTLRVTWTFEGSPTLRRAYQDVGMIAGLGANRLTINAWKASDGSRWSSVATIRPDGSSRNHCAGKVSISVNSTAHQVTVRVPVSCLPAGSVLTQPYATSGVTVLRRDGVVEGGVGSDSTFSSGDFAIRP